MDNQKPENLLKLIQDIERIDDNQSVSLRFSNLKRLIDYVAEQARREEREKCRQESMASNLCEGLAIDFDEAMVMAKEIMNNKT